MHDMLTSPPNLRPRRRATKLPRIAFSIPEAAKMLGKNAAALRRDCERKAKREGDRIVAALALGITATKDGGRWYVRIPRELLA
jgi:hypothetical protein